MKYSFITVTLAMATYAVAAPVREIEMANMEAMDTMLEERQSFPMGSAAIPKTIEEHHAAMKKIASNIPKCALKCVVSMTPKICGHEYDINSADYSCQCHAKEFSDEAAKCVAKSCHGNLVPMIKAKNVVKNVCEHELAVEALKKSDHKRSDLPPPEVFRVGGTGLGSNDTDDGHFDSPTRVESSSHPETTVALAEETETIEYRPITGHGPVAFPTEAVQFEEAMAAFWPISPPA